MIMKFMLYVLLLCSLVSLTWSRQRESVAKTTAVSKPNHVERQYHKLRSKPSKKGRDYLSVEDAKPVDRKLIPPLPKLRIPAFSGSRSDFSSADERSEILKKHDSYSTIHHHDDVALQALSISIAVKYTEDDLLVNADDCYPQSTVNCNLRSAWTACENFVTTNLDSSCLIQLPSEGQLAWNISNGAMLMPSVGSITIQGQGATITPSGTNTQPVIYLNTYETGPLSLTDDAQSNTEVTCVLACANTMLTFSTCNNYTGNPYLRLNLGDVEVAQNDNACGYGANLQYYIQQGTPCQEYCLQMGCAGYDSCEMEVEIYQQTTKDPQFVSYNNPMPTDTTNGVISIPRLSIANMTFIYFENYAYGGVFYLNGDLSVDLIGLEYVQCRALRGGAFVMLNNHELANKYIALMKTTFVSSNDYGGLMYFQNTSNVIIAASMFSSGASQFGGAIVFAVGCSDIQVRNTSFANFNAVYGGCIAFGQANQLITVSGAQFTNILASQDGGVFLFVESNAYLTFDHITMTSITAENGAGFSINSNNHHINMSHIDMYNMTANTAGGVARVTESHHIYLKHSTAHFVYATSTGAVMFLESYSHDIYILDSHFSYITAGSASVLYLGSGHQNIYWLGGSARHCQTTGSGGVMVVLGFLTTHIILEDLVIDDIRTTELGDGGVFNIATTITDISMKRLNISNVVVSQGQGGVFIFISEVQGIYLEDINIQQVSVSNFASIIYMGSNCSINIVGMHTSQTTAASSCSMYLDHVSSFSMINSTMEDCVSSSGTNFLIYTYNKNVYLENVQFIRHRANGGGTISGAAMTIYDKNTNVHVVNCIFMNGYSISNSGAIYIGSDNTGVVIAGSYFKNNFCSDSGGAIYASQHNDQLVLIDYEGYKNMQVLQSEHPYYVIAGSDDPVIYSAVVDVPSASGFVINFDALSNIQSSLTSVSIYDSTNKTTLYYQGESFWPGVAQPSLYIPSSSFYLEFLGPTFTQYRVEYGLYGIKLYVYPVIKKALHPTVFDTNEALTNGGAIQLFYANMFSIFINNVFINNYVTSGNGGALSLQVGLGGTTLFNCLFRNNSASSHGGAISMASGQFGVLLQNITFLENRAQLQGGACYFGTGNGDGVFYNNNQIQVYNSIFEENLSVEGGGAAVYANEDNVIHFNSVNFIGNTALGDDGGAISLTFSNELQLTEVYIFNNTATKYCGGGLASNQENEIFTNNVYWTLNHAKSGGAMCLKGNTDTSLSGNSIFDRNSATLGGGGIILIESSFPTLSEDGGFRYFIENKAPRGSAILLYHMPELTMETSGLIFEKNYATVGGTVYWVYDSYMYEQPLGLNSPEIQWINNTAGYAPKYGTQGVYLLSPPEYTVTVYAASINPPISLQMTDYYHQLIPLTGQTAVYPQVTTYNCQVYPYLSGDDVYGDGVAFQKGQATFNNLEAYCYPGDSMTVYWQAQIGSLIGLPEEKMKPYYISNTTRFNFRYCVAGEYIVNGVCRPCPVSTYSMDSNSAQCTSCTGVDGVETCNTNQIIVQEGYWRRYDSNTAVLPCLLNAASCPGGNNTGDTSCGIGYTGPLCAVCDAGYFQQDDACVLCSADNKISPTLIALLIIASLVIGLVAWYLYYEYSRIDKKKMEAKDFVEATISNSQDSAKKEVREGFEEGDEEEMAVIDLSSPQHNHDELNTVQIIILWIRIKYELLMVKIKIIVSTFQVVTSTAVIFDVKMPASFTKFANSFQFFNLGLSSLIPWGCTNEYNFMDTLLWTTMTPILIAFVIIMALGLELFILRLRPNPSSSSSSSYHEREDREPATKEKVVSKQVQYEEIQSKYLNYFFYLTYLVLPSVTTSIFQLFICTNVDPNHEDLSTDDYYLTADMTISCSSTYYYNWVGYAVIMIFIYPIGIPMMYLVLLYRNREEILQRETESGEEKDVSSDADERNSRSSQSTTFSWQMNRPSSASLSRDSSSSTGTLEKHNDSQAEEGDGKQLSASAARLAFLWQAYEPQFWYWEIVETSRRIILTAVLSICSPGSSSQSVLSVLLSLFYIKTYGYYQPYVDDSDDWLAEMGQFQIFFTYFTALVVQNELLGPNFDTMLGVLLSMINLGVILLAFYVEIKAYRDDIQESREREEEEKKKRALKIHQHRLDFAKKASQGNSTTNGGEAPTKILFQRKTTQEIETSVPDPHRTKSSASSTVNTSGWEEVHTPLHPPTSTSNSGMPMFQRGGAASTAPKEVELKPMDRSQSVESSSNVNINRVSKIKLDSDDEDSDD